jgi:hypothetical protein
MLSSDMSRPLISLLLGLAILAGCAAQQAPKETAGSAVTVTRYPSTEQWLELEQDVSSMETAQVEERLTLVDRSDGVGQLFYYGILNQQLPTYGAWTLARDTFQKLQDMEELPTGNRQLAGLLRKYNQSRINAYLQQEDSLGKYSALQQELRQVEDDKQLLEQKIQALTELETVISTRKEE